MYDPNEANKSYLTLFKEQGTSAAFQSLLFVISMYLFNKYVAHETTSMPNMVITYILFCMYFCWKPKLIRLLRGSLRGKEFRDKAD